MQERLQLFVGRCGASALPLAAPAAAAAAAPAAPAAPGPSAAAVWDAARRLGIPAAYEDLVSEPRVFLDALLPRAAALAEACPDAAVRVAASELLHAAVLFIVGTNARQPRDQGAPGLLLAAAAACCARCGCDGCWSRRPGQAAPAPDLAAVATPRPCCHCRRQRGL